MKKKVLYMAAIIICLSIISGGTLAYFSTADTARNVITSDGIDVLVVEQQLVNGKLVAYPNEAIPAIPGTVHSKIVTVKNVDAPAWIRVSIDVKVLDARGNTVEVDAADIGKAVIINTDSEYWTYKNGWWYYNSAVETGNSTEALFESVEFSGRDMGNIFQGKSVDITVTAQAVQKANNGETVMEVKGWPES